MILRLSALAIAAAALAGCGGDSSTSQTTTQAAATLTTTRVTSTVVETATEETTTVTLRVQIKAGKPVGGIQRATAEQGDRVALVVHSNVADEVHVHGYDLHKDVEAGGTVRIQFTAKITGVFEAELESRKLQIAELTVK
jgi:ABC-type glycerol-3-phosphate transport system substrate-binding protein